MKKIITLCTALITTISSFAQQAQNGTTVFNKASQPCTYIDYNMPANIVEGALQKKFADAKLSKSSSASDGFKVFKGINFPAITADKIDLYYKVEEKKPISTVYILTSKGYDNFMSAQQYPDVAANTLQFLNNFLNDVNAFKLTKEIEAQQEAIKEAEKKSRSLQKEAESLAKDKSKIESNLSKNRMSQSALKADMENQQKTLDQVKARTGTVDEMKQMKKDIDKQEEVLKKATKRYNDAVKDQNNLEDDLRKTENNIEKNKQDIQNQLQEIANLKKKVDDLQTELRQIPITK